MNRLLIFVPIAIGLEYLAPERYLLVFATFALAILPLAGWMGRATFPAGLVLMVLLSAIITAQVAGDGRSDWLKGLQLLAVYLIFGLLFTSLYVGVDRLQDGPFFAQGGTETGDFIFFSFTTLTTTGYGNLVPADQPGKMFSGLEMLLGQIFLVTLIAGLVSLWRPGMARRR